MNKLIPAALAAALTLFATACGDDDKGSDSRSAIVDKLIAEAKKDGVDVDRSCATKLAAKLSDADVAKIAAAKDDETPELSPEGDAVTAELLGCIDPDALANVFLQQMGSDVPEGAKACLTDALKGLDPKDMAALAGGDPSAMGDNPLFAKIMSCMLPGS